MKPKLSIIVPVYNSEKYLKKCLNSLLRQTMAGIEIIIIDDCSSDRSQKIIKDFTEKDRRIKFFIHSKNKGISKTRNEGLEIAKGEFVGFVDSDDWIDKNMYKEMYNKAKNENAEVIICNGFHIEGKIKRKIITRKLDMKSKIKRISNYLTGLNQMINEDVWNKIYSTKFLRKNRIKFPVKIKRACDDGYFTLKVIYYVKKILFLNKYFYYYRYNPKSAIHTFREGDIGDILEEVRLFKKFLSRMKVLEIRDFEYYKFIQLKYLVVDKEYKYTGKIKYTKKLLPELFKNFEKYKRFLSKKEVKFIDNQFFNNLESNFIKDVVKISV